MRNNGTRLELMRMRPHDHIGWVFSGAEEFAALSKPFLDEGAALGEMLMFVAENPEDEAFVDMAKGFDPAGFQVASISDVYGASGVVDAQSQRATFAGAMAEALADGYSGIRVAADNSTLVGNPERIEAWIRWELVADRFIAENHVTGLCAFNRDRVNVDMLRHLSTLHPLLSADFPTPQFRLFVDDDRSLCIEGEVDSFAVEHLWMALDVLPPATRVVVDTTNATLRGDAVQSDLQRMSEAGVRVSFRGPPATTAVLTELLEVGERA